MYFPIPEPPMYSTTVSKVEEPMPLPERFAAIIFDHIVEETKKHPMVVEEVMNMAKSYWSVAKYLLDQVEQEMEK